MNRLDLPAEIIRDMQLKMAAVNYMCAVQEKEPFFCDIKFNHEEVKFPENQENFIEEAYAEYKKFNNPQSSIDFEYMNYGKLLINKLKKGITRIPNGCCTQKTCYINQFYETLAGMLRKK